MNAARRVTAFLALSGATAALLVGAAAPAFAVPDPCPGGETICVYWAGGPVPIGNPVTLPPTGLPPTVVAGPRLCDSGGGNCTDTYIDVPGATVTSTPTTAATVTIPGFGIGYNGLASTVYFGIPTVTPGSPTPLGITVNVWVSILTVRTDSTACGHLVPTTVGPVTAQGASGCFIKVTIAV